MSTENILAIPSNDRLKSPTLELLADFGVTNGIQYRLSGRRLVAPGSRFPADRWANSDVDFTLALMKSKDIVKFVGRGQIPVGIVGLDTLREYASPGARNAPEVLLELGIGKCRLSLVAPIKDGFLAEIESDPPSWRRTLEQFRGLTIATEYPKLTRSCLDTDSSDSLEYNLNEDFTGSVEVAPEIGQADAVICIVESGDTLRDNKLKEILPLFDSQAVLIAEPGNKKGDNPFVDAVRDRFFDSLLRQGNPDALKRKKRIDALIASLR